MRSSDEVSRRNASTTSTTSPFVDAGRAGVAGEREDKGHSSACEGRDRRV